MTPKDLLKLQKIAQGGKRAATTAKDLEIMAQLESLGEAPLAYKAADRARAGNKAAELIKTQPKVKASEALGQAMEKGFKKVSTTQSDRTRVGGDNIGGANFSAISEADPEYARKVWGVMDEGTASRLTNLSSPETIWTTMLGSANQLKTNPVVFDKLKKQFIAAMKEGKLSKELEAKFNHNLELTFGEGAQIRDPNIWKEADTFEKRAALADLMMGQGITPKKGGVAMGGEKSGKGVIFKPTDTLIQETEPSLLHPEHGGDAPTFALGPRLFNLSGTAEMRPDLHPGFPMLLHGEDLGYNFEPVPTEVFLPTWHKHFRDIKPERFQGPWAEEIINRRKNKSYKLKGAEGPGYYDLALGLEGEGLPSQDLHDEFIRHLIREGYAEGGEVSEEAVAKPRKYVPPSQLFPLNKDVATSTPSLPFTDMANNIKTQYRNESQTYGDKGATMDIINRGPVADVLGGFVDLANLPLQGLDFLASKIPLISKPASVMEPEGERVPIARVSSDEPYGGSEAWKKQFQKSGITSKTERPLAEMATSLASPFAPVVASKAVKAGKALAPTAGKLAQEFAESTQFGLPFELNVVPPSQAVGKAAEIKAPANDLGLYSVVEKASLNLQRKSGNGDAFLSDLMKNQGVSQARLDETGLTAALKGRKGVTREEVQQLAAEGKIPLKERVAKEFTEEPKSFQEHRDNVDRVNDKLTFYGRSIDTLKEDLNKSVQMYGESNVNASQLRDKIKLMEDAYKQTYDELNKLNRVDLEASAAKYGPESSPNLNTKGGENYREILIKTPENVAEQIDTSGWKVVTEDENKYSGQRFIKIYDENNNVIAQRSGYRGSDHDAIINAAKQREKYETSKINFDGSHHSDPNVLMHLRVADHVDSEGKRGLLIDELQSDWHQKGRDRGYGKKLVDMPKMSADELYDKHFNDLSPAQKEYLEGFMKKWESAEYSGGDKELNKLINQYESWTNKQTIGQGVPDAPFKDDWYQLGLKRAIKEAVDSGMDRVYLTTGKTQADRYDLSKQVNKIDYRRSSNNTFELGVTDKNGEDVDLPKRFYTAEELPSVLGKEVAEKIIKGEGQSGGKRMTLSGLDLQVGGEGMKQYYDKTYLNFLKKYAKQHGAEVGMTTLPSAHKKRADLSAKEMHDMMDNPEFKKILDEETAKTTSFGGRIEPQGDGNYKVVWDDGTFSGGYSEQGAIDRLSKDNTLYSQAGKRAWNAALKRFGGQPVYYLDLNPALKNTAKKGQAFAAGGAVQSPNDFDYESHVNNIMNAHNASNFDYEGHVNKILGMANGGAAYNTQPDMSDGGLSIPAAAFKIGGRIPLLTR